MNSIRLIIAFSLLSSALPLSSVFYHAIKFRLKKMPSHTLIGLFEGHLDFKGGKRSLKQLDDLHLSVAALAKRMAAESKASAMTKPLFIIEDVTETSIQDPVIQHMIKEFYEARARKTSPVSADEEQDIVDFSVLLGLVKKCREWGFDAESVDFRQYSIAAIENRKVAKAQLLQEIEGEIKKVSDFNDNKKLNAYYAQCVEDTKEDDGAYIDTLKDEKISLADTTRYLASRQDIAAKLLEADAIHLTFRASKQRALIVLCFGGQHLENMFDPLEDIGYEFEEELGLDTEQIATELMKQKKYKKVQGPEFDAELNTRLVLQNIDIAQFILEDASSCESEESDTEPSPKQKKKSPSKGASPSTRMHSWSSLVNSKSAFDSPEQQALGAGSGSGSASKPITPFEGLPSAATARSASSTALTPSALGQSAPRSRSGSALSMEESEGEEQEEVPAKTERTETKKKAAQKQQAQPLRSAAQGSGSLPSAARPRTRSVTSMESSPVTPAASNYKPGPLSKKS